MNRAEFLRLCGAAAAVTALPLGRAQVNEVSRMQTRAIPSTGEQLPVVGCGTWRGFDVRAGRRDELVEVVRALFDAGGSVIDSSPMYGLAEDAVGDVLSTPGFRDRAFVATKVWSRGRDAGIREMNESFALLREDVVDLMQVHNLLDWRTQLATMRDWKAEGRLRYVGLTHYTERAHDELEAIIRAEPVDFIQINYSIDERGAENRLLPLAAERGIAVLINLPFGGGGLLRRLSREPLPDWAGELGCRSWAQLLLKFVLAHPAVTCVIPGTSNPEHMRDNAAAGVAPFPSAAQLRRLIAALA